MEKKILVSVVMPTYGQEKFISEAILGVLSQRCDFDVELIVADDCSPDNTAEIVRNIIKTHPNGSWVKYIKHEKNKGAIPNFAWTLCQANGKYIAACEGDDYWTDPLKLQKQVDFLEKNPDYSTCFHNVEEVDITGKSLNSRLVTSETNETTYTADDLAKGNFIHTASIVFKRNFDELPAWLYNSPAGDYPLHMINASYGAIKYFPSTMAAYRIGNGVWSSQTKKTQFINTIFVIKLMIANLKLSNSVIQKLNNQIDILILHISDIISSNDNSPQDPEKVAYQLPIKRLVFILLKKIRYNF